MSGLDKYSTCTSSHPAENCKFVRIHLKEAQQTEILTRRCDKLTYTLLK